jgi:3,4-dihydroxy 2-butanone 4-phosphate synthase/GTP cyclohydrolase II
MDACTGESSLQQAFRRISVEGRGVIVVLQKHVSSLDALHLKPVNNEQQVPGKAGHTRLQEFGVGAQILQDLGVRRLRLLTNTANTIVGVERYGLEVVEQLPLSPAPAAVRRKAGGSTRRTPVG